MGEAVMFPLSDDHHQSNNFLAESVVNGHEGSWFEEVIDDDLKWSFALNRFNSFLLFPNSAYKIKLHDFYGYKLSILLGGCKV